MDTRPRGAVVSPLSENAAPLSSRAEGALKLQESVHLPHPPNPEGLARMDTAGMRSSFLLPRFFEQNRIILYHSEVDRATVGGAVPGSGPLLLVAPPEHRSEFFAQRRELGVFNIGGSGVVRVDGTAFCLAPRDAIYIGSGSREIRFESEDGRKPALFYFVSYPAHAAYRTRRICEGEAERSSLGSAANANCRTIRKYICPPEVETSQLTMGLTTLEEGSVWNTMPAHTHPRRSEIYFYFDLPEDAIVVHCFGVPQETRHLLVRNRQAVVSPSWSIHLGAGTSRYSFIWAMGGENREFSDMNAIPMDVLA
ncbi:MAG: 5-dehydro-4-deoxy-D-glucuronate isomerase [Acidobacteriia bacterium]|nr:5-dehydro-4-deoxy-D-glucuronate isomerase [Terriglobia bacterium]